MTAPAQRQAGPRLAPSKGPCLSAWSCCRDIKPENIFLTGSHRFKMGDLGLAICIAEELPFTRSGTLDYMAPEVSIQYTCVPGLVRRLTDSMMSALALSPFSRSGTLDYMAPEVRRLRLLAATSTPPAHMRGTPRSECDDKPLDALDTVSPGPPRRLTPPWSQPWPGRSHVLEHDPDLGRR